MHISFETWRLDNGLRVILAQDPAVPAVAVNLWYNVGSKNERAGRTGFAHLFEHMMFQGSAHVPENGHFALIEKAGGTLNGSTWLDRTNYFETMPSNYLELALWLEADRMGWLLPAMTQAKLDNQIDVVKNERRWRVDNQPYGDWDERLQAMLYPASHPYHHSVIGSMEDISAASLEDVEAFFRTYYAPNNAVLTLCGGFDPVAAKALIEKHFGGIPAGPPVPQVPGETRVPPTLGGEVRETVTQAVSLPRLYLGHRIPPYGDPAYYAAAVASAILSWGKGSLLYRTLVRGRLAQDVIAYAFPIVEGASMLLLWITALNGVAAERLEDATLRQVEGLAEVSDEDVERAVHLAETRWLSELEKVDERADMLSMHMTLFDDPDRINRELEMIRAVSAGDVRAFARERLVADNRAVLWYVPGEAA